MRSVIQEPFVHEILRNLASHAKSPGRIYITGGVSAVLLGWRESTMDIDLKLMPEPLGIFEAIRDIKNSLNINIELASPDNFIPTLPGWQDRSLYIVTYNNIEFYHYDFYGQALAKIERSHMRDLGDVEAMIKRNLINTKVLYKLFCDIESYLIRYPSIDTQAFRKKVEAICG
jgi:hypothetical protein